MPPKIKPPLRAKTTKKETKKDGLYYQITESPMAKEFYATITDKEFINYSADFLKSLISIWLFSAVYKATTPARPAVETQTEPPRRGIVIEGRRGIVVEGRRDDNFGVAPIDVADIIRSSGADISNLSESEQVRLNDFIAATPASDESCIGCIGMGLMDDIKSFKLSPEAKKIGKDAFKALLLAGLAGAVGAYSIKDINDTKNLNYDAERTDPLYIAPRKATYDIEERAKNWASEVKHKKNMSNILDEWNDISGDVSDIGHFSGSYGLGLKKKVDKKAGKSGAKVVKPLIELPPTAITASEKFKENIKYARNNNLTGNVLKVFIATCLLAGVAWGMQDSISEEYSIDHGKILSDIISKNISLSGVVDYVNSMFGNVPQTTHFERGEHYGLGLKKKASKEADKIIPETFYQKRIKPYVNKIYDIVTSDETITVAKALAQLAFLTAVLYSIKELGTASYSSMVSANQDPRPARQVLEELAEQEIAKPTYYTEASGRYRGQVTEYDKSDYPKYYPQDVGEHSKYSEDYNPSTSKINKMLGEADRDIYRSKEKTDKLIEILKKEDPVHIKNLMLKHPILRATRARTPHKFTTEFAEHLPTLEEKIKWKKGQMLSGKGLKEDAVKLSNETMSKLKKAAKKIYDKIRSEEGQAAVKGLTVATILAGLTALLHSRMGVSPRTLSPEELKEQYMESIGESVMF
jgi:hypothetical protein